MSWSATNISVVGDTFATDPYLQYQPAFAYTLPIQLLVNGITVTLLCVLLIHLLCKSPRGHAHVYASGSVARVSRAKADGGW
jgi:hypothetical protein